MVTLDPEWARLCLFYGEPSPEGHFLAWIVEFSSDSNEDGWLYADQMLKGAAQRAGTDLGYPEDALSIEFSQAGWTRTTLPGGEVLVCRTTQVLAKPWHRELRKPTEDEQERWAAPESQADPDSDLAAGVFDDLLTDTDEAPDSTQRRNRDVDALLMPGTAAVVGNLLHDLGVPGESPEVTDDSRLILTEIQARALYLAASRSLPKCFGPGGYGDVDGQVVRVDPEGCAMPKALCHACASDGLSLPAWHPSRGGAGLY